MTAKRTTTTDKPARTSTGSSATRPSAKTARARQDTKAAPGKNGTEAEESFRRRAQQALTMAEALYAANTDWPSYFREILGVNGVVERLFPDPQSMAAFRKTEEYAEMQRRLASLVQKGREDDVHEPSRVITVRLPKSLHTSLKAKAHVAKVSLNKLCIRKLMQDLDTDWETAAGDEGGAERDRRAARRTAGRRQKGKERLEADL